MKWPLVNGLPGSVFIISGSLNWLIASFTTATTCAVATAALLSRIRGAALRRSLACAAPCDLRHLCYAIAVRSILSSIARLRCAIPNLLGTNLGLFHLGASCLCISSDVPSSTPHTVCSSIRHLDCCLFTPRLRGGACMPLRRQYSALVDEKSDESELPRAAVIFLSYSYIRLISSFVAACPLRTCNMQPSR
jgi:hypothetical protein